METAEYILRITNKLMKVKSRENYYKNGELNNTGELNNKGDNEINYKNNSYTKTYTDVVKKVKKNNIRPDNIGEIILSQIPGISSKTSKAVMAEFNSLYDMLEKIKKDLKFTKLLVYTVKIKIIMILRIKINIIFMEN